MLMGEDFVCVVEFVVGCKFVCKKVFWVLFNVVGVFFLIV